MWSHIYILTEVPCMKHQTEKIPAGKYSVPLTSWWPILCSLTLCYVLQSCERLWPSNSTSTHVILAMSPKTPSICWRGSKGKCFPKRKMFSFYRFWFLVFKVQRFYVCSWRIFKTSQFWSISLRQVQAKWNPRGWATSVGKCWWRSGPNQGLQGPLTLWQLLK